MKNMIEVKEGESLSPALASILKFGVLIISMIIFLAAAIPFVLHWVIAKTVLKSIVGCITASGFMVCLMFVSSILNLPKQVSIVLEIASFIFLFGVAILVFGMAFGVLVSHIRLVL